MTDGKRVALLMAGLPNNVSTLLNHKTVRSFAAPNNIIWVALPTMTYARRPIRTIQENDRLADAEGIDRAVRSISGFPFLLQLVRLPCLGSHKRFEGNLVTRL